MPGIAFFPLENATCATGGFPETAALATDFSWKPEWREARLTVPRLRMGLVGFADEAFLASVLRTRVTVRWESWAAVDADALWINGAGAQVLDNGMVRVVTTDFPLVATTLDLHSVQRPYWFSLPLGDPKLRAPAAFDPRDARSIDSALREAEKELLPLALQLAVAGRLVEAAGRLGHPTYELRRGDELVAVVNVARWVALHPHARPHDIGEAECIPHAQKVAGFPFGYERIGFAEMMWLYAKRMRLELLPDKYRTLPILFRAVPKIRRRLLGDIDLLVLSDLMAAPQTMAGLGASTRLRPEVLVQALTALYLAGSITTDPAKAALIQNLLRRRSQEPPPVPEFESLPPAEVMPDLRHRRTVPGTLLALLRSTRKE